MKIKSLFIAIACGLALCATNAVAQNSFPQKNLPIDGQQLRLDDSRFWKLDALNAVPLENVQKIADDLHYPALSPAGNRVLFFKRDIPGKPSKLLEWSKENPKTREILKDENVSRYVAWQDDDHFLVRQAKTPFLRESAMMAFAREKNAPRRLENRALADDTFVAYDLDDIIILESKKTKTLQAISDPSDRYFAPVLSPDNRFVAFTGLKSGVNLFDIEANAVVFVSARGSNPAFSPDGQFMVYAETRDNGQEMTAGNLILVDLVNHSTRMIANPHAEIRVNATLSRNAEKIAYENEDGSCWLADISLD